MQLEKTTVEFNTIALFADIRQAMNDPQASLRDIADKARVSAATLSRIENGKTPDISVFMTLCGAFNLNPDVYFVRVRWKGEIISDNE